MVTKLSIDRAAGAVFLRAARIPWKTRGKRLLEEASHCAHDINNDLREAEEAPAEEAPSDRDINVAFVLVELLLETNLLIITRIAGDVARCDQRF